MKTYMQNDFFVQRFFFNEHFYQALIGFSLGSVSTLMENKRLSVNYQMPYLKKKVKTNLMLFS